MTLFVILSVGTNRLRLLHSAAHSGHFLRLLTFKQKIRFLPYTVHKLDCLGLQFATSISRAIVGKCPNSFTFHGIAFWVATKNSTVWNKVFVVFRSIFLRICRPPMNFQGPLNPVLSRSLNLGKGIAGIAKKKSVHTLKPATIVMNNFLRQKPSLVEVSVNFQIYLPSNILSLVLLMVAHGRKC